MHTLLGRLVAVGFVAAGLTVIADSSGLRPVEAGGGCRGIPSTEGSGDSVRMVETCFLPTVLHIAPGTSVSFENASVQPHTVSGATLEWGNYNDLPTGETVQYTFDRPGTYPYYCFVHNGMTGAIVVGDGMGSGGSLPPVEKLSQRATVSEKATIPEAAAPVAPATTSVAAASGNGDSRETLLAGALGALAGAIAVAAGFRVRSLRRI